MNNLLAYRVPGYGLFIENRQVLAKILLISGEVFREDARLNHFFYFYLPLTLSPSFSVSFFTFGQFNMPCKIFAQFRIAFAT